MEKSKIRVRGHASKIPPLPPYLKKKRELGIGGIRTPYDVCG